MIVTLYKSSLCPRCYLAKKHLHDLKKEFPEMEIKEIDIVTSPGKVLSAGIKMIPAIVIEDKVLSSIYLGRRKIAAFLQSSL